MFLLCLLLRSFSRFDLRGVSVITAYLIFTGAECKTSAKADMVLLVDGSWSIGRLNFKTIRAFIARMVGVFDISPERVQIGEWFDMYLLTKR